jgi:hypothetical protein
MNHRTPGEAGLSFKSISGMQRLWYFAVLFMALAGVLLSLKHIEIPIQKGL